VGENSWIKGLISAMKWVFQSVISWVENMAV